jgi:D-sedoheptulose 7-phosphate isomerase
VNIRPAPIDGCAALFADYAARLHAVLRKADWTPVRLLAEELQDCWSTGRQVILCGNGGSAANAIHLANDYLYAVSKTSGCGLRAHALSANASVLTCLANDEGYDQVYSLQLGVLARPGDVLIAFSGSGNSPNILKALEKAREIGMRSYAILGFSGGKAKGLTDVPIHFAIDDMQISEDLQIVVGHMVMQWLFRNRPAEARGLGNVV